MLSVVKPAWIVIVAAAAGLAPAARAEASPLADAIARHAPADVEALRAQLVPAPGAATVRCALGAVYARRGDLSRAMLYLAACSELALPPEIAGQVATAVRETRTAVRASELSELEIVTDPPGVAIELEALRGEPLVAPLTVWVKAGAHTVRATVDGRRLEATITTRPYARAFLPIQTRLPAAPPPKAGRADFTEDNAAEAQQSGPPPAVKRPSMMSARHRGIPGPRLGPELEDPLARRTGGGPRPWFGVRLGGGVFDDGSTAASLRPSVAAAARVSLTERSFVAARLDWSRRGGTATTPIDSAGVSLGGGTTVLDRDALAVALIVQLRGDLRFADTRDMVPVRRAGATVAAGLELAVPSTPLTAGVRFEQGLTELTAGARDRAVLVELGVDWR